MLYTIAAILIILWLLGFVGFDVVTWYIHLLLVVAIIIILLRVIRGQRPL